MKRFLPVIALLLTIASCKTSKDYLSRRNDDKTVYDIVKQLNKKPDDELATKALPEVYNHLQQQHLERIATYKAYTEPEKWDKVVSEYKILQGFYEAISNSHHAAALVNAMSYEKEIESAKLAAADEYYMIGLQYLENNSRTELKKAYTAFKKSNSWIKNYKNAKAQMDTAKERGIVNVVINPVQDYSHSFSSGWGNNNSYELSTNSLPLNLVRDMGGTYAARYPARFYTERQADINEIQKAWVIDLTLRSVDIPRPTVYNYTRSVNKSVEVGKDSAGHSIYQTVYATLHIQRQSFDARMQMDINITDGTARKNIAFDSFTDNYNWQQEVASYSGDNRALGSSDWNLINNRYNQPTKDDVMSELYRSIYPKIKNKIAVAVEW